ncbi:MAG: MarR family transcriptional regulator [Oscillospiraceae bacterium]|nr:MarR family transcriptional regulator [Oscillospiraceae bacterium]
MALEKEILKEYLSVTHEVSHQFRAHYGKINLTFPQAMVLSLLETEGIMPISALAEQMGSANSTISGVVDRLERMNFVRRNRSEMDRRVIFVEITEHYQEVRDENAANVAGFFGKILEELNTEDQETVLKGLQMLNSALEKHTEDD